jgi:PhoH-like ATPase
MKKNYILDTNVLLSDPCAVLRFEDNNVFIPGIVIEELDGKKNDGGETGFHAREAARLLESILMQPKEQRSVTLSITSAPEEAVCMLPSSYQNQKPDNQILAFAKWVSTNEKKLKTVLVTNDTYMRIKGKEIGILTEDYESSKVEYSDVKYTGRRELSVPGPQIDRFYRDNGISSPENPEEAPFTENEYLIMKDEINPSHSALCQYRQGTILPLTSSCKNPFGVSPRNVGQQFAIHALMADVEDIPLVILKGGAGTAKTFLAMACGLQNTLEDRKYDRILFVRPNIKFDEDIGYLKGSEEDKIAPLIRPCMDNLEALFDMEKQEERADVIQELFDRGTIKAEAMAYMRGRSIQNTFLILDEAQNATPNQILGIITRAGEGTKIVITGDFKQIDNPKLDSRRNGLVYASERMKGSPLCAQIAFDGKECVRSRLAKEAAERLV